MKWRRPLDSDASRCFDAAAEPILGFQGAPMLRATTLVSVFIAVQGAAMADDAKPPTVEVHGKALQLSCAEWKRNQDGSWSSLGALLVGTETMEVTLRGAKETGVLEEKCGNGSAPATKAKSPEPTRHARHTHRPAKPE
jgi:hypothetical protein